ncbi:ATP-dependent helicase HrpB [Colwelliaceae bacterium BS250]
MTAVNSSHLNVANDLPIATLKQSMLAALHSHAAVILSAPPGAGKSTSLPLWLLESEQWQHKKIIMLQPRRIAAKSVASRLAQQLGETVGETVGYRMRFDTKVSKNTRLEVVTEGILTRLIQADNELSDVGLIIFDEFHERSIHADLAFALALDVQQGLRDDLTLLLMSATLDNDYLAKFLPDAKSLACDGRSYPIEVSYQPANSERNWRVNAITAIRQQVNIETGSILVFLPGTADIRFIFNALNGQLGDDLDLHALYGDLDIKQQQYAIAPSVKGRRKVVLATNIAETSLTIDGITLVIDSGYEKVARFNQDSLINELKLQKISKASATQRAGRAGRLQAGRCLRLYSQEDLQRRLDHASSEISQADLLPLTLEVARWGVSDFQQLSFLQQPSLASEQQNWQTLHALEVVTDSNRLTKHGELVASLPCHPRFAHMLIKSLDIVANENDAQHCLSLACLLAALLEERDILPREQASTDSDVCSRLYQLASSTRGKAKGIEYRIINQARNLASKLQRISPVKFTLTLNDNDWPLQYTGLLLAFAYPERIAVARNSAGNYLCANGKGASVNDYDSLVGEPYLACALLHSYQQKLEITLAASIQEKQIYQYFSEHIKQVDILSYDDKQQKIINLQQTQLQALILDIKPAKLEISAAKLTQLWCDYIKQKGLNALKLSDAANNLLARVRWLNQYFADEGFPDFSASVLIDSLDTWLGPYLYDVKKLSQLQQLNFYDILYNSLTFEQQKQLGKWAPKYYTSPTGREHTYIYSEQPQPKLALQMQQVYGLSSSPYVANGQVAVLLELLSPARRPIQVTQDLARFWQGSYKDVQKDMKANYPRHFWPDDPANAKATNQTKKHMINGN